MQPAPVTFPCVVASFIGFAHLLRRDVFLDLGGYQESFIYYGEEKDFCLRLLDAGYRTVYLPDARIAHSGAGGPQPDALPPVRRAQRLPERLYNDPVPRVLWTVGRAVSPLLPDAARLADQRSVGLGVGGAAS